MGVVTGDRSVLLLAPRTSRILARYGKKRPFISYFSASFIQHNACSKQYEINICNNEHIIRYNNCDGDDTIIRRLT